MRRLCRSPATAACLSVFVVMTVKLAKDAMTWLRSLARPLDGSEFTWTKAFAGITESANLAIPAMIAVWIVITLTGGFKSNRDWVEIFGLILALGWLVLIFESPVCDFLWTLER